MARTTIGATTTPTCCQPPKTCWKEPHRNPWLEAFAICRGEKELTDELAHALIERVEIYSDNRVEIKLRYQDEYRELVRLLGDAEKAVAT